LIASNQERRRPQIGSQNPDASLRVAFVGDVMLDRTPGDVTAAGGNPFEGVAALLADADVAVGNLECVVATGGRPEDKPYTFRAHPRCLPLLKRHLDAVSLANNHTGDFGKGALVEMLDRLGRAGVPALGAGRNRMEARKPWIVERNGIRLAVLGYNGFQPRSFEAGHTTPGVAWSDPETMIAEIRAAQSKADVVIPFLHWGTEYEPLPDEEQRTLARSLIEAGAAGVVGGHPHVTQTIEVHRNCPIVYSLGNFVFDDFRDLDDPELLESCRRSWVLRLTLDRSGVLQWDTVTTRTDDRGFPQIVGSREAAQITR
jgi:poly-gamma-glutamate synthesis protein (capsule biosynthesis protein)